jgi:hypothetical protein
MRRVNNKNAKLLKIIEPEETGTSIPIDPDLMVSVREKSDGGFKADLNEYPIQTRDEGEFAGKALYLNNSFDWEFGHDSFGLLVIVPLRKVIDNG